jgi:acetoacetyl-CoA synthetase
METQQAVRLWAPDRQGLQSHPFMAFLRNLSETSDFCGETSDALQRWSLEHPDRFWNGVWDFFQIKGDKGDVVFQPAEHMRNARFFPQSRLNFADNLLGRAPANDQEPALIFRGEDKVQMHLSWAELKQQVSQAQQAMAACGVGKGDRVAAMMPNMPQTVVMMLAATSLGAIWSSCSPDFGVRGVMDRFGQIEPKLFIACDGYWYNGKRIEIRDKLQEIVPQLPTLHHTVIVSYLDEAENVADALGKGLGKGEAGKASTYEAFLGGFTPQELYFEQVAFDHPVYIMFSSGTTGVPKCIVHATGGVLLQHVKELGLHCGLKQQDRLFYFTTCGWMMWNWMVSGLALGCTLCLYDGSPFAVRPDFLFDYAQEERFALFGTSAKYIDALRKAGARPVQTHDLSSLRLITSTGSPLPPENFDYVYQEIARDVQLASISGGTDIVSCFVLGIPDKPVYKGEIQGGGFGLAVDVWNEAGEPAGVDEKGELVCTQAFPCMPVGFWNDPDGEKYHKAYFDRFDNIWCHGDFASKTAHGGFVIHGRSDATLNPGGVRIGTAEIYNQVEKLPVILEALAIGQDFEDDVRVILFVRLAEGVSLDEDLIRIIRRTIREGASPRHVPAKIIAVKDIPRTKSGKIVELAVRDVVHGRTVKNKEALANPEALALFENLPDLQTA